MEKTVSKTLHVSPTTIVWENGLVVKNVTKISVATLIHTLNVQQLNEAQIANLTIKQLKEKKIYYVDNTFTLILDNKVVCNCNYVSHKWDKYPKNIFIDQLVEAMKIEIAKSYNIRIS